MLLGIRVVAPLFLLMALGYGMRRLGLADLDFFNKLNSLIFKVFLPVMLFNSVYTSDFSAAFQPRLVLLAVGLVSATFALSSILNYVLVKDPARRGVIIQGECRTNYVLFGIPVAISLFGADQVGITAVLIAFVVPLFNLYSTIVLEMNRGSKVPVGKVLLAIATNPLIDATLIAFLFMAVGLRLPGVIETAVTDVSSVATPLAIIVLGGTFRFSRVGHNRAVLAVVVAAKLVLLPLIFVGSAALLGLRGVELGAFLAMSASPTAVSSFPMAQQMGGDGELAGQVVVMTTAFSMVTLFVWVTCLSGLGLL